MNNENIKEILDRLDYNEWEIALYKVPITWCELYDIRDYITNLQQENERLKERVAYLERSNNRREDTIIGLRQEINDVEDKNSKLEIALQNIQEDYDRRLEENERLKQEYINVRNYIKMRNVSTEVEDKALLYNIELENINKKKYLDYKSRCEKAIPILNNIYMLDNVTITNNACEEIDKAINTLKNGSEENNTIDDVYKAFGLKS